MEPEFWKERWLNEQIGFHQNSINPFLKKHWARLGAKDNVFVPLCGKSLDMLWLKEQGCHITGVEISEVAVRSFFEENNLPHKCKKEDEFQIWTSENITVYCGDFFKIRAEYLKDINAVYDRASLIALPPSMRKHYVDTMKDILPSKKPILLVTLEYDQSEMQGPPFSVHASEVQSLFSADYKIEEIDFEDVLQKQPGFRQRGLSALVERIYILSS